jgi:hypothetical protein
LNNAKAGKPSFFDFPRFAIEARRPNHVTAPARTTTLKLILEHHENVRTGLLSKIWPCDLNSSTKRPGLVSLQVALAKIP